MSFYSIQSKKDIHSGFKIPLTLYNELNERFGETKLGNYIDFPYQIRHIGSSSLNDLHTEANPIQISFVPPLSVSQSDKTSIFVEITINRALALGGGNEYAKLERNGDTIQSIFGWLSGNKPPFLISLYDENPPSDGAEYQIIIGYVGGVLYINDVQWYVVVYP